MNKKTFIRYTDIPKCPLPPCNFPDVPYNWLQHNGRKIGEYYKLKLKPSPNFTVLTLGCSYASCDKMEAKDTWSNIVCNYIEEQYKYDVLNLNLALGAASNDYISRMLIYIVENFHVDLVLILFTFMDRRELCWHTGDYIRYGPWLSYNLREQNPYKDIYNIQNEHEDKRNFNLNFKFVNNILSYYNIQYIYGFAVDDIEYSCQKIDDNYLEHSCCVGTLKKIDYASDNSHPGIKSNHLFAKNIIKKIRVLQYS